MAKPSGPPGSLNIAYVAPADSFVWEMTAYKQGLFQKYGLTVNQPVFVGGTPRLGAAVVGGTFDAAGVGFSAAVDADAAGADLEAVAALSKYAGFSVIVPADSPIKTPKDLKGKTIALSQIGDTADAFLTRLLQQNGLNRATDVNVTQAGSTTNALGQVLAKKVDAASVGNADAFNGQTKGARILANSKSIGMLQPQGSILVKKSWAESHRPQLESLLKAMIDANAKYRSSQEEGLKELQDSGWFKDVPTDVLTLIWKDDVDSWNQLPFVDQDAAKAVIEVSAASNPKVSSENVTSLYDNSYVQELVTQGAISAEQARNHPHRNMVTQALGITSPRELHVETRQGTLQPGMQFLLCSDGLTEEVEDETIARVLAREELAAQECVEHLVLAALEAGGSDNITVLLVRVR